MHPPMQMQRPSSSAEMLSSDSKEVVSSMGKEEEVCEVSATQVAEFETSPRLRHKGEKVGQGDARAFSTGAIISLAKKSADNGLGFWKTAENILN